MAVPHLDNSAPLVQVQLDHEVCGRCSNIPECCIDYWMSTFVGQKFDRRWRKQQEAYRELILAVQDRHQLNWYYRPCPECLGSLKISTVTRCSSIAASDCYRHKDRAYLCSIETDLVKIEEHRKRPMVLRDL